MIYLRYLSLLFLLTSLLIFFFGYLPKTIYKKHESRDYNYFQRKTIDKVLLIVIDSLRPDMVYNKKALWPSVYKNINKSWTYQTIAELQPPSMSLAKVKCIITGAVISFIDVIFNTDSGKIAQENLIDIVQKYRNFKVNLYGDETWIKLFPNQFSYSRALSPFFINDFYDIDNQITENIPNVLSNFDSWDFVILHYLGLDHIGHSVGPFGSYVDTKLSEIDNITGSLVDGTFRGNSNDRNLLILTADHGMSDLGGHGGSSQEELHVPLIFFNTKFKKNAQVLIENLTQNDIAPSLALLLGVPIPEDNIGVIPFRLLSLIDGHANQTDALYSNYYQLIRNIDNLPIEIRKRFSAINSSIFINKENCEKSMSNKCVKDLRQYQRQLISLMNDMKTTLKTQFIQHNLLMLELAFFLSSTALIISTCLCLMDRGFHVTAPGSILLMAILFLLSSALFLENFKFCFFSAFKISSIMIVIVLTAHSMTGAVKSVQSLIALNRGNEVTEIVVVITLFINLISLSFKNMITEEHQVWFYLSATLLTLLCLKEIISETVIKKEPLQWKSSYVAAIVIMLVDRILRTLNRTGERWSSVLVFGDWLNGSENCLYLIIVICVCLLIMGILHLQRKTMILSIITTLLMLFNGIHRYTAIFKFGQLADVSVWIYYALVIVYIGISLSYQFYYGLKGILKLSNLILLICLLICRHQNVILWTGIAIKAILLRHIWLQQICKYNIGVQFIIFNILGMTSYFQQGNSNSLTSIDVHPGFVGMPRYIPAIIGPLVALQLFSGNLYWIITWLEWLDDYHSSDYFKLVPTTHLTEELQLDTRKNEDHNCDTDVSKAMPNLQSFVFPDIIQFLTLISSLYSVSIFIVSILHIHQMVAWSVYAPKLLFHSFHHGITLFLYIFIAKLKF